ncbi:hypothetical protein S-CBS2_gp016 [Synechococcus phage S-CBS2]|uniref:hypothetical protein n=1 Tax=Synechococcus phage S-CBS2 TaxID=753084 RepID=UPI00020783E9|nr:hypothetical protein S-CBS2_gp016 [Synechococcus phage S-CBS2]ADF42372.1 hypothetical protein S-CBS2_gp016 [Synechococcus phage S-CBS2]
MIEAYKQCVRLHQYELFAYERPIAVQTALHANLNRDPKKRKKPFSPEDYYLYQPREDQDLPAGRCGSAALALIQAGKFPSWGLFCYKELASAATGDPPPFLAFISECAILLAPVKTVDGYKGMLIAQESASDRWISFIGDGGTEVELYVPTVPTKTIAQDNVMLRAR